ncbi:YcbK family protein [Spartinivicinus ruber]|uniref:YcbK family protein n=1 Tax=Spartinivicinus ruber TaxID=2683272 RepID=UPI001CA3EDD9|nr:DUF882 domain-containing protein [Spartinivicinus ruber]
MRNRSMEQKLSRRQFLMCSAATLTTAALSSYSQASIFSDFAQPAYKSLVLNNTHTGEKTSVTFWEKGKVVQDAMSEINRVLRDHRSGEVCDMDPELMDLLFWLKYQLDVPDNTPFNVISGYRSPKTNAMLRRKGRNVAKNSFHMKGRAIDIAIPGRSLKDVRSAALSLKGGGVGYYPGSGFIHLDTGPTRIW